MLCFRNSFLVDFGKAIHIIVIWGFQAEVLRKIDYLHILRYGMFLEKCLALAMSKTEEHDIDTVKGHL